MKKRERKSALIPGSARGLGHAFADINPARALAAADAVKTDVTNQTCKAGGGNGMS
jgi:hypothetical protein